MTLHVWRVPRRAIPLALARMAIDPYRLRATPGVRFGKLLGTGKGRSFGPADADPTRYAAVAVWDDAATAEGFADSPVGRAWHRLATAEVRLDLRPLSSRGRWSGREPFETGAPVRHDGPVLALTRARLRPSRAVTFWRSIAAVATELDGTAGLLARFGIGEAPLGWQGTVSVWRSTTDLIDFAYRQPQHGTAIARTATTGWYAEELFARFAVLDLRGDRSVLGTNGRDHRG